MCLIIGLVVLIFGAFGIYKGTNGGKESLKGFYIEYENKKINSGAEIGLKTGANKFSVKAYVGTAPDITVKVVSNDQLKFDFLIDKNYTTFEKLDFTKYFNVEVDSEGFTINVPEGANMKEILQSVAGGEVDCLQAHEEALNYFLITVKVNGKVESEFKFNIELQKSPYYVGVNQITLSDTSIVLKKQ